MQDLKFYETLLNHFVLKENEVYLQRANRQKKVVDITYKFTDTARGGINGRGRGRGGREGRGGRGYSSAGRTVYTQLDMLSWFWYSFEI